MELSLNDPIAAPSEAVPVSTFSSLLAVVAAEKVWTFWMDCPKTRSELSLAWRSVNASRCWLAESTRVCKRSFGADSSFIN